MKQILLSKVQNDLLRFLQMAQEEDIILIYEGKPVGYLVGFLTLTSGKTRPYKP